MNGDEYVQMVNKRQKYPVFPPDTAETHCGDCNKVLTDGCSRVEDAYFDEGVRCKECHRAFRRVKEGGQRFDPYPDPDHTYCGDCGTLLASVNGVNKPRVFWHGAIRCLDCFKAFTEQEGGEHA